jgi:hypothetical protein
MGAFWRNRMLTYRLAEGTNPDGLPFISEGHAYLADGTPITEVDYFGRVVPAWQSLAVSKATCSGGVKPLSSCRNGTEALARALESDDPVRASLILLLMRIDPTDVVAKFNPFHKPDGPGGGQFTSGPSSHLPPGFQQVATGMGITFVSTYREGLPGNEKIDIIHKMLVLEIHKAILAVTTLGFRAGMPGYGQALHEALDAQIELLGSPNLHVGKVYLDGWHVPFDIRLPGSSAPDVVYGPIDHPLAVFELKTGRAADTSDAAVETQKQRTLKNMPNAVIYDHFLVRTK